jgi:hypothetical protein
MADESSEAKPIGSRWKWGHPILLCGLSWFSGVIVLLGGLAIAGFMSFLFPLSFLLAYYLLGSLLFGLLLGLSAVWWEKRWLKKTEETYSHWMVFSQTSSPWKTLRWQYPEMLAIAGLLIYFGATWLFDNFVGSHSLIAWPGFGMIFLTQIFLYPERARIYYRAKQLAAGKTPEPLPEKTAKTGATRATSIGLLTIAAVFALGIWLLLWRPWSMNREPHAFTVKSEPGGKATRLTYGISSDSPRLAPDGKTIAFLREKFPFTFLEIMGVSGKDKRRLAPEISLWADPTPHWSSDSRRLLVVVAPLPKNSDKPVLPEFPIWPELADKGDAWIIDRSNGRARRLTDDGKVMAADWLSPSQVVMVKRENSRRQVWLMSDTGQNSREIPGLGSQIKFRSLQIIPGGKSLLVRRADKTLGWWIVDTITGKARKVPALDHKSALPLDPDRIVVIQNTKIGKRTWQAAAGLLDLNTGKINWVIKELKGGMANPTLGQEPAILYFSRIEGEGVDLWGLNLKTGQLRRLTKGEDIHGVSVNPRGKFLIYSNFDDKRLESVTGFLYADSIWRLDLKPNLWKKTRK